MFAVGIDVSSRKSTVAVLSSQTNIVIKPFDIPHTPDGLKRLVDKLNTLNGKIKIVLEHPGRYYEAVAMSLHNLGFFVSAVNPLLIQDYNENTLRKVKTDNADAVKIARYTLSNWETLRQYTPEEEIRYLLKTMNTQYQLASKTLTAHTNNLIALMEQTYSGVKSLFSSPARPDGSQKWMDYARTFWHVDCVCSLPEAAFTERYRKWCKRNHYNFSTSTALELYADAKSRIAVVPRNGISHQMIKETIALVWNQFHIYIFMGLYLLATSETTFDLTLTSLVFSILYAVSGLTSGTGSLFAMRYGKMSTVTTFCLLGGMILPFFYGVLFLQEEMTLWKTLGILVLIGSLLPSILEKDSSGVERTKADRIKYTIFCMMTFCGNGFVSVVSKAHQISEGAMRLPGGEVDTDGFILLNTIVGLTIALVTLVVRAILAAKQGEKHPVRATYYEIGKNPMIPKLFGMLLALAAGYAVCNAMGNIFSLQCAVTMDSSIQFPILSGVVIFMTAVFGWLFFWEWIEKANLISLSLTLVGIGLFMIPA